MSAVAAHPRNDLPDAITGVGVTIGVLGRETLVHVRVAVDHKVGSIFVESLPERLHISVVAMT